MINRLLSWSWRRIVLMWVVAWISTRALIIGELYLRVARSSPDAWGMYPSPSDGWLRFMLGALFGTMNFDVGIPVMPGYADTWLQSWWLYASSFPSFAVSEIVGYVVLLITVIWAAGRVWLRTAAFRSSTSVVE